MRNTDTVIFGQRGIFSYRTHTSLGWIRAISDGQHLVYLDWNQTGWTDHDQPDDVSRETITQLTAYFKGDLRRFDLPLLPAGASQSRRRWLDVMAKISFGTTISYAAFATAAGHPKAARAAGTACATNPIPIIYPCHRILRTDGRLGNYSSGSHLPPTHQDNLQRKAFLISHETQQLNRHPSSDA
ncbi:methylated-DNA--[protein]-cysteine S-methyltransferase [Alphaproteobacteria bacterium]|nr:methylated-DNA--[protein]-cysteine S-methyltransferase [Alphaproteobacteria bacterium]